MVSQMSGGSDDERNLITACDRCNNGKNGRISVPKKLRDNSIDRDGWITWKRWGGWHLKYNSVADDECESVLVLSIDVPYEYWIDSERFHEDDWHEHIWQKSWATPEVFGYFCDAMAFARAVIEPD